MPPKTEYAITITAREQAELLETERDARPLGPREVAGRTLATLVSAGTEVAGAYQGESFPRVPGYAAVFEVETVGSYVEGVRVGDHALCMGPHRSYQRVSEEQALRVPEGLTSRNAVFARIMSVSMSTLTTTTARPPAKVLVMGLGLVGHLARDRLTGGHPAGAAGAAARRSCLRRPGRAGRRLFGSRAGRAGWLPRGAKARRGGAHRHPVAAAH